MQRNEAGSQQTAAAQFYSTLVDLPSVQLDSQQHSHEEGEQQQQQLLPAQQQQQQQAHAQAAQHQQQQPHGQQQQMPFAPIRFSTRTQMLDPNTGTVTLPPKSASVDADTSAAPPSAAAAARSSGRHQHRHKQQQLEPPASTQQQQPAPAAVPPAARSSRLRPLDCSNIGFQLLSKAGWQEGQGLGANEQGMAAPLAVSYHKGNTGLGFSKQQQQLGQPPAATAHDASAAAATAAHTAAAGPVLGGKRVAALVAAELAAEDLDTKVRRHRQLREQKAKEDRDKAIQSYMFRAFNDVEAPDSNPLLAKSHRLTATNPLLD